MSFESIYSLQIRGFFLRTQISSNDVSSTYAFWGAYSHKGFELDLFPLVVTLSANSSILMLNFLSLN
jgi:hypothetical protein